MSLTTVIVPTTGVPEVERAVESVMNQTYATTCYLVVDGEECVQSTQKRLFERLQLLYAASKSQNRLHLCVLPINVGANGFYGHRIYAAFTHLVDTKYVSYLDQDNWLEPDHVEQCVETIQRSNLDWCHSLRKIYDKNGEYLCHDNCESLGKWSSYHGLNHIDTNTYFLKTEIAIRLASVWHGGWGQDRVFFSAISHHFRNFDTSGKYTVNYRVDGQPGSVNKEFFENGNKITFAKYHGVFPWKK